MRRQLIVFSTLLLFGASSMLSCSGGEKKTPKEEVKTDVYTCPMKCNNGQTYDKPGKCTECEMDLEKVTKS